MFLLNSQRKNNDKIHLFNIKIQYDPIIVQNMIFQIKNLSEKGAKMSSCQEEEIVFVRQRISTQEYQLNSLSQHKMSRYIEFTMLNALLSVTVAIISMLHPTNKVRTNNSQINPLNANQLADSAIKLTIQIKSANLGYLTMHSLHYQYRLSILTSINEEYGLISRSWKTSLQMFLRGI